jgi:Tol biopolymer transport system component
VSGGGFHTVIAERDPNGPSNVPAKVVAEFGGLSATWSPDGRSVAFLNPVGVSRSGKVIVRDVASGTERAYEAKGLTSVSPRWFSDGSALLLPLSTAPQQTAFFKLDLRSGTLTKLFEGTTATRRRGTVVALSPDDRTVYLNGGPSDTPADSFPEVLAIDVATGTERIVMTAPPGDRLPQAIALSPDGSTLLLSRTTPGASGAPPTTTVLRVGTDGQGLRTVVGPVALKQGNCADKCVFTPDGRSVLFSALQPDNTWRIMRVPIEGGTPTPDGLDFSSAKLAVPSLMAGAGAYSVAVSPDGTRIAFGHSAEGRVDTWAIDNMTSLLPQR